MQVQLTGLSWGRQPERHSSKSGIGFIVPKQDGKGLVSMSGSGQGGTTSSGYDPMHRRTAGAPEQTAAYGQPGYQPGVVEEETRASIAASGLIALAAVLMIMSGLWSFFVGITGVLSGGFYIAVRNYTFSYSIHAWGWTHLIIGAVVFAAGVCVLLGMMWARVVGVILAVISGLANFLFLPYYPLWSIVVIALDAFIIWALVTGVSRRRVAA
jgi:hypothetical protein